MKSQRRWGCLPSFASSNFRRLKGQRKRCQVPNRRPASAGGWEGEGVDSNQFLAVSRTHSSSSGVLRRMLRCNGCCLHPRATPELSLHVEQCDKRIPPQRNVLMRGERISRRPDPKGSLPQQCCSPSVGGSGYQTRWAKDLRLGAKNARRKKPLVSAWRLCLWCPVRKRFQTPYPTSVSLPLNLMVYTIARSHYRGITAA